MEVFWKSQLDYVFFVYGLSFILFGYVCLTIRRLEYGALSWEMLAYFGFIHGACEWLDLCAISIGDNHLFSVSRLVLKALSFSALFIFFLQASPMRSPGRYLPFLFGFLLVVLMSAVFLPVSVAAIDDVVRWIVALPGCMLTATIIYRTATLEVGRRKALLYLISVSFACYGLVAGATVPNSEIVPVWAPSHQAFLSTVHVPVQVFRAIFAIMAAAALWGYEIEISLSESTAKAMRSGFRRTLLALFVVCVIGWILTYWLGQVDTGLNGRRLIGIVSCLIISLQILIHYAEVKQRLNVEIKLLENQKQLEHLIGHLEKLRSEASANEARGT